MIKIYKSLSIWALVATLFVPTALFGQTVTVSGKVTGEDSPDGLPGVTIIEKGTTRGTTTNFDGTYTLNVTEGATLVYSFIGYVTQEIAVNNQSTINIVLELDITALSEVVVIGYGQVQKKDLTGSVAAIDQSEFNKGMVVNTQDLLAGKAAGVQITSAGGAPGAGSRIRIRGGSSINASNEPLIVIDGMPIDNEQLSGSRNQLSIVNPNDIASVSILKDASATAIYGSRASNGVIIITTKRGKKEALSFSYNGNFSINTVPNTVDVLNGDQFRTLVDTRAQEGDAQATLAQGLYGTENTDWQNEVLDTSIGMDHNLSATGAVAEVPFRLSLGYTDQDGIVSPTNFTRTSIAVGVDPSLLDDHLNIKLNFKGMFTKNQFTDEGRIVGGAVNFDPTQPIRVTDQTWGGYFFWPNLTQAPANPVAVQDLVDNEAQLNRYLMNAYIDYKLPWVDGLSANLNLALDLSNTDGLELVSPLATWESASFGGLGKRNEYTQEKENKLLEANVVYDKELGSGRLNALAGYSWQYFKRENIDSLNNLDEASTYTVPANVFITDSYLISFYGRLNYTLKERYLFTFTLRRDGSSKFQASGNEWGTFPSAAFAWKINEESFMGGVENLNELKLRLSWGITGQQDVFGQNYPALPRYNYGNNDAAYQFGQTFYNTIKPEAYDGNLKWEETTTYNIGVDFGLFNSRLSGTIDFYQRETKDALSEIPIPLGTNFSNRILTNIGTVENNGFEIGLNGYLIDQDDISLRVGANVTRNVNEITKLSAVDDPNFIGILTGGIGGGVGNTIQVRRVGEAVDSFFMLEQVYDEQGNPIENLYVDQNGDGIINDFDRVVQENPVPKVYLGINSEFNYKQLTFSFSGRANIGNHVYNNVSSGAGVYSNLYQSQGYLNNVNPDVFNSGFEFNRYLSNYYLYDASFFRMDYMSLGYHFPRFFSDDINASFSFTVQNAFVITDYEGLDPEVQKAKDLTSGSEDVGIDNNLYPRPRSFVIGISVNF